MRRSTGSSRDNEGIPACNPSDSPARWRVFLSMMNSGFSDPNNHVPEATQDDEWGDAIGHEAATAVSASVLPPRRLATEKSTQAEARAEIGIRIDKKVARDDVFEVPQRLQVQEIRGEVIRLEQEAQAPPKVDRVITFLERPARLKSGKKTRGEAAEWGLANRESNRWILAMGAAMVAVVSLGIFMQPKINATNAPRFDPNNAMIVDDSEDNTKGMEQLNVMLEHVGDARNIYGAFATAGIPDEILALIRDSAAVKDQLLKYWTPMGISPGWSPGEDCSWLALMVEGRAVGVLEGILPDRSAFKAYFVLEGDGPRLDWKASTGFGTAPFEELKIGGGDASEVRGVISNADFYSNIFPEEDFQCFRLTSPDKEMAVWCYSPRSREITEKLAIRLGEGEILEKESDPQQVTLSLEHGPEGTLPNQWLMGEPITFGWVSP
jgi:hypothetical protein